MKFGMQNINMGEIQNIIMGDMQNINMGEMQNIIMGEMHIGKCKPLSLIRTFFDDLHSLRSCFIMYLLKEWIPRDNSG